MNQWINFSALAKILIGGLICGAGLPALFAIGLRALQLGAPRAAGVPVGAGSSMTAAAGGSIATATPEDDDTLGDGSVVGKVIAGICFLVVLAAVAWGIYWIVTA